MDDPKNFREMKIFFKVSNGPIRKVNMLKPKFDDIFVPAPLLRSCSALRNFFDRKKKFQFFFSILKILYYIG